VLEIRRGLEGAAATASAYKEYAWDLRYIDAPVCRWWDADADGQMEPTAGEQHYYTNDAQFNATALLDANSGAVLERYMYDPYGKPTFLDANWTPIAASTYENEILYCGYRYDPETGLYQVRNRYLNWLLGRWDTTDLIGYADGANLYEYCGGSPSNANDAFGTTSDYLVAKQGRLIRQAADEWFAAWSKLLDKNGKIGKYLKQRTPKRGNWDEIKRQALDRLEAKVKKTTYRPSVYKGCIYAVWYQDCDKAEGPFWYTRAYEWTSPDARFSEVSGERRIVPGSKPWGDDNTAEAETMTVELRVDVHSARMKKAYYRRKCKVCHTYLTAEEGVANVQLAAHPVHTGGCSKGKVWVYGTSDWFIPNAYKITTETVAIYSGSVYVPSTSYP